MVKETLVVTNIFIFVLWLKGWMPLFCALLQVFTVSGMRRL